MQKTQVLGWRDAFSRAGEAIRDHRVLTDERNDMIESMVTATREDATGIYEDLCQVQIAVENNATPVITTLTNVIDWTNPAEVRRFRDGLIDDGRLVDRVADSIELPVKGRLRKWSTQRIEESEVAQAHRENADWFAEWSRFCFRSRTDNHQAYDAVRSRMAQHPPTKHREWHDVILMTPPDLSRKQATFWYAVQTARCSLQEKRAVCHKLTQCEHMQNRPELLLRIKSQLLCDIYIESLASPKRSRLAWIKRIMRRMFGPRLRKPAARG